MSSESYFNITQASEVAGVSLPTIRKAYKEGKFPNASETFQGKRKAVRIPMQDLRDAGFLDRVTANTKPALAPLSSEERDELITLRETAKQLSARLEEASQRQEETSQLLRTLSTQIETRTVQENRSKLFSFRNRK